MIKRALPVAAVLALAACGAAGTTARTTAAPASAASDSAVASARAALASASADCVFAGDTWNGAGCYTPPASPVDAWCSGSGYSDYQAVQSDITQMSTDVGNGDYGTAENDDAPTLDSDATTALQNPPPGTTAQKVNYVSCMGAIAFGAIDLNSGNIPAAEKAMTGASTYRDKVVDAVVAACAGS